MALTPTPVGLALGPILFNWPADRIADFYARIADEAPVDRVYLGEIVCGKRSPLSASALADAHERLRRAGKTVVWSSLVSPVNKRERNLTRDLMGDEDEVEINDFGALRDRSGRAFVAGPYLNVYNEAALAFLQTSGCRRWCPGVELPLDAVATMARACPDVDTELFAYGRLPLAISGRCYHARQNGLNKDSCQYVCEKDPDGAGIHTLDGTPLFAYNGVQTLSYGLHVCTLSAKQLRDAGVSALRLSPHSCDMVAIARAFRDHLDGRTDPASLQDAVRPAGSDWPLVNGYLTGKAGRVWAAS